ncbi:PspC domain-containing protein [Anoxybacillus ayderensis]|uniref:PspC domain-containing protein n=1 Tax=Anoxybacillus TaxID=150247 RepID=UPI0002BD903B|nr:PspC domain-containing protein [Anoxybacillus gonensis]AXM89192.1 PspC domain-containing protein [Anoxybacillus ayderensis G10]KHF29995.1 DNA-binding transcriptional activator PspC [Anoxybacillus sp. BCO1]MBW9218627.1 PspC domain-containing protein [Anoxybacillus sp. ST70]THD17799.1 PspC domain-containing protein [Anoxybacillus ayderensis]EMI10098.1 phage shock protein C [Anoxybacillus gonensis]
MKKLVRLRHDRMVGGVLSGLAAYMNMDATVVRLLFVALLLITGIMPFAILYALALLIIPSEENVV